ncbi:MAG TPA: N-methyl-D-aspartate receptor NMDAR2C subunit [Thermomonas sp.]|nr:N-methyl-D-aspartate receptor NMDAR2C subunit [Thermomonas sp.]
MTPDRWQSLMHGLGLAANEATFVALSSAYRQPHRRYHTARHIADCLAHLDDLRDEAAQPHAIELAIWFHDAIYDPYRSDNEQASADWAMRFLRENDAPASLQDRVQALILATRHDAIATDRDMAILIDIDLSILGAPADAYDTYRRAVRSEYRWVPGPLFRRSRRAVLESFLRRERIFLTDHFHASLETRARSNIHGELEVFG